MNVNVNSGSFKKGLIPWNKTAGIYIQCGHCNKEMRIEPNQQGRKKFCSKDCFYKGRTLKNLFEKGHADLVPAAARGHSEETKIKIKQTSRANAKYGAEHFSWKGGAREKRKQEMRGYQYRDWRNAVFGRDNWTCQECKVRGGYLEADHIKPWCAFPELRYEVSNGRTLCKPCHVKQDTHGRGALKYLENKT